jgi:hypothetical protein
MRSHEQPLLQTIEPSVLREKTGYRRDSGLSR